MRHCMNKEDNIKIVVLENGEFVLTLSIKKDEQEDKIEDIVVNTFRDIFAGTDTNYRINKFIHVKNKSVDVIVDY